MGLKQTQALTSAQRRIWFAEQLGKTGATYLIPAALRLRGPLDPQALQAALHMLPHRHPMLNARFATSSDGQPVQYLTPPEPLLLRTETVNDEDSAYKRAATEVHEPLDLAHGPLIRALLVQVTEHDHLLVMPVHHLVCDGMALAVLQRDLLACYDAVLTSTAPPPAPRGSFQDAVIAEHSPDRRKLAAEHELYVAQRLESAPDLAVLPCAYPRPSRLSSRGFIVTEELPADLAAAIQRIAASRHVTPFAIYCTALHVLLARYGDRRDSVIGFTTANRYEPENREIVGLFASVLPLRLNWAGDPTAADLLMRTRTEFLNVAAHGTARLEKIVDRLKLPRTLDRHPLFQVLVNHIDIDPLLSLRCGLAAEAQHLDSGSAWVDLEFSVRRAPSGRTEVELKCHADLFDHAAGARILTHFQSVLGGIITAPDQPVSSLPLLTPGERHVVLAAGRGRLDPYAGRGTLRQLLIRQILGSPERTALRDGERTVSYRDLGASAAAVARRLRDRGVRPGSLVGVCAERSAELVMMLAGIIAAGAAYLPLDPDLPVRRLRLMIEQASPLLVVASPSAAALIDLPDVPIVLLNDLLADSDDRLAEGNELLDADNCLSPDSPAYVIFTSGSTGRPKGVVNTQGGIHNRLTWMQDSYQLGKGDAVLHKTSLSFDVSVWEMFWPLVCGAQLIVAEPGKHRDADYLRKLIATKGVTVVHFVPSMLRAFLAADGFAGCPTLRHVFSSGEALTARLRDDVLRATTAELHNLYGPTEAAIDVTAHSCQADRGLPSVPIGRAVPNTRVLILNSAREIVPFGLPGELYLGGVQLATGYIADPARTAERFIPDPYSESGDRLYRTGDLAMLRPDGSLEFIGRADRQVKLRGFRIELGEIEAATERVPGIRQAVVLVQDEDGRDYLACYLVADPAVTDEQVRQALVGVLPSYMLPSVFHFLDALPKLPNGKVDHSGLTRRARSPSMKARTVASGPRSPQEERLLDAMRQVLRRDDLDVEDSFFSLGGDSIRSIELVVAARQRGLAISVEDIFTAPSVRDLATIAQPRSVAESASAPAPFALVDAVRMDLPGDIEDALPLSTLLSGLVIESARNPGYRSYMTSLQLKGVFDEQLFRSAVATVFRRHPFLRSSLLLDGPHAPLHLIHRTVSDPVTVTDLRSAQTEDKDQILQTLGEREAERRFDWPVPPLIRISVHLIAYQEFKVTVSEPFLDGWSATLLLTELLTTYEAALGGGQPAEEHVISGYGAFLQNELQALASPDTRGFWQDEVADAPATIVSRSRAVGGPARQLRLAVPVPQAVSDGLHVIASQSGAPIKSVLLACHIRALAALTGQTEVVTGLMSNARPDAADGARAIGLFLNTNLLRVNLVQGSWADLLDCVRAAEARLLPHRRYPYAQVLTDASAVALTQALFNYTHFYPYQRIGRSGLLSIQGRDANDQTYFPLTAQFSQEAGTGRIGLRLEFFDPSFTEWDVARIRDLYAAVLHQCAMEPGTAHHAWSPAGAAYAWTCGPTPRHEPAWLPDLFAERVTRDPDAVALVTQAGTTTYRQLHDDATALAERLRQAGAQPGNPVAVAIPRSPMLVTALLAVLSVGAIYLPIDPSLPRLRQDLIIHAAHCRIVLTPGGSQGVIAIDTLPADPAPADIDRPRPFAGNSEEAAVLIFTSGTTGQPKGVLLTHRAVHNRLAWGWRTRPFTRGELVAARTPIGFVDSIAELLSGLLVGTPTLLLSEATAADPRLLIQALSAHRATRITLVPTLLTELLSCEPGLDKRLPQLRHWTLSGEPLPTALAHQLIHQVPHALVDNLYGSSEVAADVTAHRVDGNERQPLVPLGRPIDGCLLAVLDGWGNRAPQGAIGELVVAGRPVGLGYVNDPGLTRQRFVPTPHGLSFRTGDLVRTGPDGILEYVGRADRQLKVRGVRLEPAEIEAILRGVDGVRDAVVTASPTQQGLVAYLQPDDHHPARLDPATLREAIRSRLTAAALPTSFLLVHQWPRTASGKINHRALPAIARPLTDNDRTRHAPRTLVEKELARLWGQRLKIDQVHRDDDFFDLGGNSLHAILLITEIQRHFGVGLDLQDIFEGPSLAEQARTLEYQLVRSDAESVDPPS